LALPTCCFGSESVSAIPTNSIPNTTNDPGSNDPAPKGANTSEKPSSEKVAVPKGATNGPGGNPPKKQQKPSSGTNGGGNPPTNDADADTLKQLADAQAETAALKQQLKQRPVTGAEQVQKQLQDKITELEATVRKQNEQMHEISGEKSDMMQALEKLSTSPDDKQKQQEIAQQLHHKFQREQTKRAGSIHNPNAIASSIIDVTTHLDRWIQAHEDTITEVDTRSIVAEYKELGKQVDILQSRVTINEL